ncbi:MAG: cation:proton antiporter [Anaerolineales bacterium]
MSPHQLTLLFFQLSLMLIFALLFAWLARRFRHPSIVGELVAGLVLGQTIFGWLAPNLFQQLFLLQSNVSLARDTLLLTGMLFFLFSTGMEVNLNTMRGRGMSILLVSGFGILIPFVLGAGMVLVLPNFFGYDFTADGWILPLFLGTALGISALPIIARILLDLNLLDKEIGSVILTSAVLNDLVGWAIFAVCLNLIRTDGVDANLPAVAGSILAALGLIWFGTMWLARPLLYVLKRSEFPGAFIIVACIFIFVAAALAEWFGIHPVFGAFLVGVVFAQFPKDDSDKQASEAIQKIAVYLFAPLYFVSVGLKVNFAEHFDLWMVLLVTVVAVVSKVLGAGLGARLGGFDPRTSVGIGFGMSARGAIEIILASVALEYQIIDGRIFVALVVMALVTSMVSGVMLKRVITAS